MGNLWSIHYISLPSEEAHRDTHPTCGAHCMVAQRANPNIAMTISELVVEGMLDSYEICQVLKHYVTVAMCASTMTPMIYHTIQLFLIYQTMFIKLKRLLTYQNLINEISNKIYFRLFVEIQKYSGRFY